MLSDRDLEELGSGRYQEDEMPYCVIAKGSNSQESEALFELQGNINVLYERGYRLDGHVIHYTSVQNMGSLSAHVFVGVMIRKDDK